MPGGIYISAQWEYNGGKTIREGLPRLLGVTGLYLTEAAAWIPTALFLAVCYYRVLKHKEETQ